MNNKQKTELSRKILSRRFALVESFFDVYKYGYYEEEKANALKGIIRELFHIACELDVDTDPFYEHRYDLEFGMGIFRTAEELKEHYSNLLGVFTNP